MPQVNQNRAAVNLSTARFDWKDLLFNAVMPLSGMLIAIGP